MGSDTIVFLGPTLPKTEARTILDALYLPPVAQGDVYNAYIKYNPKIIGIIDGYFENVPSVWHKEILFVLSKGVHVLGGSSMGALRAAELHPFGMEGVGKIYEAFKNNLLEDDDEVAVYHGPAELGYPALSEAMVNIRETAWQALENNIISQLFHEKFIEAGKALHYKNRTYHNILKELRNTDSFEAECTKMATYLKDSHINVKWQDALELLKKIKQMQGDTLMPKVTRFHFEETFVWLQSISKNGN